MSVEFIPFPKIPNDDTPKAQVKAPVGEYMPAGKFRFCDGLEVPL